MSGSFSDGFSNGFDIQRADYAGRFRFLKDHFINGEYIFAGEIREMFQFWIPSADVEPLDTKGVNSFYAKGPQLGGVWRTVRSNTNIYPPLTYWVSTPPNIWSLTGLGANLAPISAIIGRIEDKEV
jgi:hypothetical protein